MSIYMVTKSREVRIFNNGDINTNLNSQFYQVKQNKTKKSNKKNPIVKNNCTFHNVTEKEKIFLEKTVIFLHKPKIK